MSDASGEAISLEDNRSTKSRCSFRWWHGAVIVLLVVVACVLMLRWHWKRGFRQRIAALAAAGYPVTPEELGAWYPAPESGENGAQAVLDAAEGYIDLLPSQESRSLNRLNVLARRDPIEDEVRAALERLVADNQEMLGRLHEAAGFAHCHYDIDWSADSPWAMRPLPSLYKALTLLQRSALLAFEEGRVDDAMDSLVALLVIGRSASDIPTLSGFLRGARSRTDALDVLERGMHRTVLTDEQLQRLGAALWTDDTPEMLGRALASHMCLLLPRLERPSRYPDDHRTPIPVLEAYEALGLAAREGSIFLGVMESYMEVTQRPLHEWQDQLHAIDTAVQERLFGCILLGSDGGFSLSHIFLRYLKSGARLRTARVALAVERYRLAHGALPVSLEDLAPEYLARVPQDPYTGQDLRYEKLGTGFVVYSLGEDGRDDGGWEEPPHDRRVAGQTYDITFTVER